MSTAIQKKDDNELLQVLGNSLYVGAKQESIKMVLDYCHAAGLDPMEKPVHIVPMYSKELNGMRDVIMPGIGLYRIQATRSGSYAGTTEPIFGEDVTEVLEGIEITYPKWCKVTTKRVLNNGDIAEFTAIEFWKENYATKKRDSIAPNAMWQKRPYAQLAKCAESQSLRKAFPEFGSQPTAEEMEGKEIDITPVNQTHEKKIPEIECYPDERFKQNSDHWKELIEKKEKTVDELILFLSTKFFLSNAQIETIKSWGENESS
jgi:phage recombination protein Bet